MIFPHFVEVEKCGPNPSRASPRRHPNKDPTLALSTPLTPSEIMSPCHAAAAPCRRRSATPPHVRPRHPSPSPSSDSASTTHRCSPPPFTAVARRRCQILIKVLQIGSYKSNWVVVVKTKPRGRLETELPETSEPFQVDVPNPARSVPETQPPDTLINPLVDDDVVLIQPNNQLVEDEGNEEPDGIRKRKNS
ncbi:hypothetical protein PIB30_037204 [Stylosanthes scabra]|uniref:Uncharacterized protein n=1 Tax=Stylosanthes scabra TaxID=79078 RepID=A0ABU6YAY2_9FABA|nr:hypothetical protein [Stylosanthes scabra]